MSKQDWLRHRDEVDGGRGLSRDQFRDEHDIKACAQCRARSKQLRVNRSRRETNEVMRTLGMTKTAYGWE